MAELTLILNFVIIFLLITAIVYGFVLNRRIKLIRESGRELSHLFRSFDNTILRAEEGIEDLKKVSGQVADGLQKKIDRAVLLVDELEFLGEKATQAAEKAGTAVANFKKIEGSVIASGRAANVVAMSSSVPLRPTKSMIPEKPPGNYPRKKALEDLLDEVSGTRQEIMLKKTGVNNNTRAANVKIAPQPLIAAEGGNLNKKQSAIASALKAMGFGE